MTRNPDATHAGPALHGLLAEFDSPGALLTAAERVRDAGYTQWDAHSPFPVHGIDAAMGIRPTRLPWLVFVCGVLGCAAGLSLQWWTNAADSRAYPLVPAHFQGYAFHIGGKPVFSLPANIPVVFELTVLLSALATVIGMLAMNNLPRHHTPLFAHERFKRATTDRFYVFIAATDPVFDALRTHTLLSELHGLAVERVDDTPAPARFPRPLVIALTILICVLFLPPLFVAKAHVAQSEEPRVQIIQDMGKQEHYKTQRMHPLFADARAMRPQPPGTIARGDLRDDAHYFEGKANGDWTTTFPPRLEITETFVRRGQQRFNIYCSTCHGLGGAGDGIVAQRALALDTKGWTIPTSLVSQTVIERPLGHIFNTITNGIRTMPPYGDQIPERDRWAIIAYIRALQRSQNSRVEDVPVELRPELR